MNKIDKRSALGAMVGTAIPLACIMKSRKTYNPIKLDYKIQDMLVLSGSSVVGGTIGGMIGADNESKKKKIKEGTFQLLNVSLPAIFTAGALKICEKTKNLNGIIPKIGAVTLGIGLGIFSALKLSNFIFDPKDKHPDRELSPKDFVASADDAIGALALAKFPIVNKVPADKILPVIYSYCGYRAGKAN
jgi:hypothetical protein